MNDKIISTYSWQQGVEDGYLVELFKNRWEQLTNGKPILVTKNIFSEFSLAAFMEIWNEFAKSDLKAKVGVFSTKMNMKKVWVIDDGVVFTIMFPEDY